MISNFFVVFFSCQSIARLTSATRSACVTAIIVRETKELIRTHTNALLAMHKWWCRHRRICRSICSLTRPARHTPKKWAKKPHSESNTKNSAHIKLKLLLDFSRWIFRAKRTLSTSICHYFSAYTQCHTSQTHTDAAQFNVLRMRWHILVVRHTLRASLFEFFASIKHPQRKTTNSYHFVSHFFHAAGKIFANVYCMRTVYGRTGDAIISNCRIFRIRDVC